MESQSLQSVLEEAYTYLNYIVLVIVLLLELYVVAYKLRFKMDKAALVILLTQLIVMIARTF